MEEPIGFYEWMLLCHDGWHYENNSNDNSYNSDDISFEPEDDLCLGADPYSIIDD